MSESHPRILWERRSKESRGLGDGQKDGETGQVSRDSIGQSLPFPGHSTLWGYCRSSRRKQIHGTLHVSAAYDVSFASAVQVCHMNPLSVPL